MEYGLQMMEKEFLYIILYRLSEWALTMRKSLKMFFGDIMSKILLLYQKSNKLIVTRTSRIQQGKIYTNTLLHDLVRRLDSAQRRYSSPANTFLYHYPPCPATIVSQRPLSRSCRVTIQKRRIASGQSRPAKFKDYFAFFALYTFFCH